MRGFSDARIDPTGAYRYMLMRRWGHDERQVLWVMLNPSTADALQDDPTVRRCRIFSRRWGYGGMTVVNLFALRATDPRLLAASPDPVGPDNDATILEGLRTHQLVIAAWGVHGALRGRDRTVRELMQRAGAVVHHLGLTSAGQPKHPLYLRGDTIPHRWEVRP